MAGRSNPADIAVPGATPQLLIGKNLWWEDPARVLENGDKWPKVTLYVDKAVTNVEIMESRKKLGFHSLQISSEWFHGADDGLERPKYTFLSSDEFWDTEQIFV